MHIDRYGFGELVVDRREIRTDVLVTPGGVAGALVRREGHVLHLEDLGKLLDSHPQRLIIGTGAFGHMRPDPGLGPELAARGVTIEMFPTAAAVDRINELLQGPAASKRRDSTGPAGRAGASGLAGSSGTRQGPPTRIRRRRVLAD